MRFGDVVAIVGDAQVYCLDCFAKRRGTVAAGRVIAGESVEDKEGNTYGVILYGTEDCYNLDGVKDKQGRMQPSSCGGCHRYIVEDERELVMHQGALGMVDSQGCYYASYNWNDCDPQWPDECECGEALPDDNSENCPNCGQLLVELTFETCEECGERFTHGWVCLDGGELYCSDCVTVE